MRKCNAFFIFYFLQKQNMFAKNLVLDLWSKNQKTNQNVGFLKLQYLTKNLSYAVGFLDMTRGPRKH